jgi:hypothetical protein
MEILKYKFNDNYQIAHIKVEDNPNCLYSTVALVHHEIPGNALFSSTILEMQFTLRKSKMAQDEHSEINNSIYTGTLDFYIPDEWHERRSKTGDHVFFLTGSFVSHEVFLKIQNKLGVRFKNQTNNSLSNIADKLVFSLIPFFRFIISQGNNYAEELLIGNNEDLLKIIGEARSNPQYK